MCQEIIPHVFNPSTRDAGTGGSLSSRTSRATQRKPVFKKKVKEERGVKMLALVPRVSPNPTSGCARDDKPRPTLVQGHMFRLQVTHAFNLSHWEETG